MSLSSFGEQSGKLWSVKHVADFLGHLVNYKQRSAGRTITMLTVFNGRFIRGYVSQWSKADNLNVIGSNPNQGVFIFAFLLFLGLAYRFQSISTLQAVLL